MREYEKAKQETPLRLVHGAATTAFEKQAPDEIIAAVIKRACEHYGCTIDEYKAYVKSLNEAKC